jgi:hypothetical protein
MKNKNGFSIILAVHAGAGNTCMNLTQPTGVAAGQAGIDYTSHMHTPWWDSIGAMLVLMPSVLIISPLR